MIICSEEKEGILLLLFLCSAVSIGKKMLLRIHKIGRNPSSPTPTSRGGQTPRTTPSFGREISTSPSTSFNKTPYLTTAICIRRNTKYKIITLFLHPSSF
ncbi:unnamed protein product [Lepeophtheirus salmonis]|uniref:(salmon louse) hypothetical protein n=1 Tax=Lepeophtheirus salmonis TaxID=72036 RepID=A0A7R8HA65_LEPSM|nr:unnamed protein product [Lepeophtheirus salmonis]CAF2967535.1 unnamed protein product [Lepeophtheirus salmonis]